MNLADMLSFADIHQLSRIADHYECECSSHSKNELIQNILSRMSRKEVFEQNLLNLTIEDIRFLNSLLFDPRQSFSLEELTARASQSRFDKEKDEKWNPREVITKFRHYGWLFNGHSHHTKYLFQLPEDLKQRFEGTLARHFEQKIHLLDGEPGAYRDEQGLLAEDIYQFLHYLYQQEVDVTAEGTMYKRSQQHIMDRFAVREELVGRVGVRFGYGRKFKDYPNRFSFIYDYCYYNHLIQENGLKLTLTELGAERIQSGRKEDVLDIYKFWLRLYKGPVPNIASIVHWVNRLSTSSWIALSSIMEVLLPLVKPFYYDTQESVFQLRILQMMMHLGLLRIGEDESSGTVIKMTKLGSSIVRGVYVADEERIEIPVDNG
ncbi:hypothetical protein [Paenibacillus turpanensis]|uniref:hypothetical protein n=1 Tax=Paenibacillus turpanensis TaxID=2689078 RepID=UPI00140B9922|nr:hypothetical protein [Paenibacillus turpanensis]